MISVIMPSWNRPVQIFKAIASFEEQNTSLKELIVVDDGSSEDYAAVEEYLVRNGHKYFRQPHSGEPTALNNGIRRSSGEHICILHDDDQLNGHDSLERRSTSLERLGVDFVYTDAIKQSGSTKKLWKSKPFDRDLIWREEYISFNSMMWNKRIHTEIGDFSTDFKHNYDYHWKIRCVMNFKGEYLPFASMLNSVTGDRLTSRMSATTCKAENALVFEQLSYLRSAK
jgi:glycosyltransferase involved in cell wall biosynthesis